MKIIVAVAVIAFAAYGVLKLKVSGKITSISGYLRTLFVDKKEAPLVRWINDVYNRSRSK